MFLKRAEEFTVFFQQMILNEIVDKDGSTLIVQIQGTIGNFAVSVIIVTQTFFRPKMNRTDR